MDSRLRNLDIFTQPAYTFPDKEAEECQHGERQVNLQVVLEPSDEGRCSAHVPSLPGCISKGDTVREAMQNIREAVELYLEPMEDDSVVGEDSLVHELAL